MSKQGFIKGAVILTAAGVICRLLGVAFRIPLSNIVGNYGIGLYQLVFPLYSLLLIISSAGMPVAISKMIARVREDRLKCKKILFNALLSLSIVGAVISALFIIFARQIAELQGNQDVWSLYIAIAPAVFFVCFISAFRGYFQGLNNMVPTAISQIVEQLVKVGVGLTLAFLLISKGIVWAVLGAIIAVSVSEFFGVLVLWIIYLRKRKNQKEKIKSGSMFSWKIIKDIFITSAPITIMSLIFPLVLMFDSFFIVNALTNNGVNNATELYGIASGAVHTLINLPTVVGLAIAAALIPVVSRYYKQNKMMQVKSKAWQSIIIAFVFGIFSAFVLFIFPKFILQLLYGGAFSGRPEELQIGIDLLRIESLAVIFISLTQVISSVLQGIDKSKWPMLGLLTGGTCKVLFEIFFIKELGIMAVSISNVLCFATALLVNVIILINFMRKRR